MQVSNIIMLTLIQIQFIGYPVSQGEVKGPARIILNFDEVDKIKVENITHRSLIL